MSCIGEPISWLRLERRAAGDADSEVSAHLLACPTCRACFERLSDDMVLPPLPAVSARPRRFGWPAAIAAAMAAAVLLFLVSRPPQPKGSMARAKVKGAGEVTLSLVRERGGDIAYDPSSFDEGDRFKLRITCPPGAGLWTDVVVFQGDQPPGFPLPPAPIACGNAVTLPGAFRLDGAAPARVCVALDAEAAPDRAAVGVRGALICATLEHRR